MNPMIFDTNILVAAFLGEEKSARLLAVALKKQDLRLSVVVIAELNAAQISEFSTKIDELSKVVPVFAIDMHVARLAGDLKQERRKKRTKTYLPDCFIAATALMYGCTLVTKNKIDFQFPRLKILNT